MAKVTNMPNIFCDANFIYWSSPTFLEYQQIHQKLPLSGNSVFNNYAHCHVFITLQIHTLRSFPHSFP